MSYPIQTTGNRLTEIEICREENMIWKCVGKLCSEEFLTHMVVISKSLRNHCDMRSLLNKSLAGSISWKTEKREALSTFVTIRRIVRMRRHFWSGMNGTDRQGMPSPRTEWGNKRKGGYGENAPAFGTQQVSNKGVLSVRDRHKRAAMRTFCLFRRLRKK